MLHRTAAMLLAALVAAGAPAAADPGDDEAARVTFHDLAADEASGIDYRRVPSATNATYERIKTEPLYTMPLVVATPEKPRGSPGVALLDFDGDGDLDLYVTNGPGAANSLYANRLEETGTLRFEDVAKAAGVAATDQDSTGVCFGDLDNDGDPDLVVLGRSEPNRLFENRGDGTFRDVTAQSAVGESDWGHTDCSVGDVDGDGLLDLAVANSYDWSRRTATLVEPWEENHPNQLFVNQGGLRFRDASVSSGIRNLTGFRPPRDGAATITWALALVDYDQDGDLDLFQADDQGGLPPTEVSRGLIQVLNNDGTGRFTAVTDRVGTDLPGTSWMGFAFADFDCDGHMDFFATNMGDYVFSAVHIPFTRGQLSSRAFLGTSEGGFEDAGPGALRATPFGWSVVAPDLDNDGDPDVVFWGSLDGSLHTINADNPGAVLLNRGCSALFEADLEALAVDHARRNVHGGATGDLNRDGFPDLVTASAFDIPEEIPLKRYPVEYDSPFDAAAGYVEVFAPAGGDAYVWNGLQFPNGRLAVEINDGNDNGWIEIRTLGTVGLLPEGRVNRDGVGAVIRVTPDGGPTTLRPVTGGSGFASQNALAQLFGLGDAETATVEVLWPGGTVHRLHDVRAGERIVFPEIPCDPRDPSLSDRKYRQCVTGALKALRKRGLLSESLADRFLASALRAPGRLRPGSEPPPAGWRARPGPGGGPARGGRPPTRGDRTATDNGWCCTIPSMLRNVPGDREWGLLFAAWLVAAVATAGSLFFSHVMGFAPCVLCWYQRIFLFPLVVVLAVGLFPVDRGVVRYALPLAGIGWLVAAYHNLVYAGFVPESLQPCTQGISCTEESIELFGVFSIPLLSLLAFTALICLLLAVPRRTRP